MVQDLKQKKLLTALVDNIRNQYDAERAYGSYDDEGLMLSFDRESLSIRLTVELVTAGIYSTEHVMTGPTDLVGGQAVAAMTKAFLAECTDNLDKEFRTELLEVLGDELVKEIKIEAARIAPAVMVPYCPVVVYTNGDGKFRFKTRYGIFDPTLPKSEQLDVDAAYEASVAAEKERVDILEILTKWERIINQIPYCRDELKESQTSVHMPVPHPDRDPESKDQKKRTLVCPPITWADLHTIFEYARATTKEGV